MTLDGRMFALDPAPVAGRGKAGAAMSLQEQRLGHCAAAMRRGLCGTPAAPARERGDAG